MISSFIAYKNIVIELIYSFVIIVTENKRSLKATSYVEHVEHSWIFITSVIFIVYQSFYVFEVYNCINRTCLAVVYTVQNWTRPEFAQRFKYDFVYRSAKLLNLVSNSAPEWYKKICFNCSTENIFYIFTVSLTLPQKSNV